MNNDLYPWDEDVPEPPSVEQCAAEDWFDQSVEPWFEWRLATARY